MTFTIEVSPREQHLIEGALIKYRAQFERNPAGHETANELTKILDKVQSADYK